MLESLIHRMTANVLGRRKSFNPRIAKLTFEGLAAPLRFKIRVPIDEFRIQSCAGERELLGVFIKEIRSDDVVFDLGAQLGLFTIAAAVRAPTGRIVACEPDPAIRNALAEHIELNSVSNVHLVANAISNVAGTATLFSDGVNGYSPSLRRQDRQGACTGLTAVETTTIDNIVRETQLVPNVMKIDIEGAEILALGGMQNLLRSSHAPRTIFLELHPDFLPLFNSSAEECLGILTSAGYEIASVTERLKESQLVLRRTR